MAALMCVDCVINEIEQNLLVVVSPLAGYRHHTGGSRAIDMKFSKQEATAIGQEGEADELWRDNSNTESSSVV